MVEEVIKQLDEVEESFNEYMSEAGEFIKKKVMPLIETYISAYTLVKDGEYDKELVDKFRSYNAVLKKLIGGSAEQIGAFMKVADYARKLEVVKEKIDSVRNGSELERALNEENLKIEKLKIRLVKMEEKYNKLLNSYDKAIVKFSKGTKSLVSSLRKSFNGFKEKKQNLMDEMVIFGVNKDLVCILHEDLENIRKSCKWWGVAYKHFDSFLPRILSYLQKQDLIVREIADKLVKEGVGKNLAYNTLKGYVHRIMSHLEKKELVFSRNDTKAKNNAKRYVLKF
jgi:hypothetical protein